MIEEATIYRTSDGTEYSSRIDAEVHEHLIDTGVTIDDFAEALAEKRKCSKRYETMAKSIIKAWEEHVYRLNQVETKD